MNLIANHEAEFLNSRIHPDIIALNFTSLEGDIAYSYLIPNITEASERVHPDAQWWWARRRYSHIEVGGWWCGTFNPIKGFRIGRKTPIQSFSYLLQKNWFIALLFMREYSSPILSQWGCFKPNAPRRDPKKASKTIKYEHPPKTPTELFCLDISPCVWQRICDRLGVPMPEIEVVEKENSCGVQFWDWVLDNPQLPIILTEGAKKAASLLSVGYIAIALPGINSGYRTNKDFLGRNNSDRHITEHLQMFAVPDRNIYFGFDQDAKYQTRINCDRAIEKTATLLERQHGCKTFILSWHCAKGVDDFIKEFGEKAFHYAYQSAVSFVDWRLTKLNKLNYVSKEINREKIGELEIPESAKIIGVKSAKGTGKTEFFVRVVAQAHANFQRVLILTHRVQLGQALAQRFGVPYVTEIRDKDGCGEFLGYALCVDSLHGKSKARFNPNDWNNAILIIDEAEQVLWHTLNANTEVSKHRITILNNLQILIANILNSQNGKIFLADADLTDISINWVKSFVSFNVEPYVIVNKFKPNAGKAYIYSGKNPANLVLQIEKAIEEGKKVFVCCTGQRVSAKWGTIVLERKLQEKFPDIKILRIDSESVSDPSHPAFGCIPHLNSVLNNYDLVLASPSIETGVSIDITEHFTAVFGIFQGVSPDTSVRQALARLRETVDRHIWVSPIGMNFAKIGNGSINPLALMSSQRKQMRVHTHLMANLLSADVEFQQYLPNQEEFQLPTLKAWATRGAIINAGFIRYRDTVIKGLKEDGYTVEEVIDLEDATYIVDELKAIKERVYAEEKQAIADAEVCSESEYQKLKDKLGKTRIERRQQRKMELLERYGVEITPELVEKDDDGWYPQLRMYYFLTIGQKFLLDREKHFLIRQSEAGEGNVWKPDFNKKALLPAVKMIDKLGIKQLLISEKEWKNDDDVVESIARLAIEYRFDVKDILGVTISDKNTPITIVQKLLEKIGVKLEFSGKKGGRGKQKRVYKYIPSIDGRDEVLANWLSRDEARYAPSEGNIAA